MKRLLLTASLIGSLAASGQDQPTVYRWTDAEGEVHYTDNASNIPERYRKKAEKTAGDDLFEVRPAEGERRANAGRSSEVARPSAGPDEQSWRKRFAEAHARIASLEAALEADRLKLQSPPPIYNGVPQLNPDAAGLEARIEQNERALVSAREALEDLDRQASRESVPRAWRVRGLSGE